MTNSRDPALLHPTLQRGLAELMRRMADMGYTAVGVSSTFRCNAYQDHLFAQGRTRSGAIVTNARGGQSIHNHHQNQALAFDIFQNIRGREWEIPFFNAAGRIWEEMGGTWGGSWVNFVDRPHFEFTAGRTLRDIQDGWRMSIDVLMPWEEVGLVYEDVVEDVGAIEQYEYSEKGVVGEMRYHTIQEMPEWARATIQKLVDRGVIQGRDGNNLDLSEDMLRMLVINDRAGLYD